MHVHVPAGAVPKDGPSAGVTMTTALASLLSGRLVRSDVAMTGEVSLTGRVLPIGGVKQKLLAAHRAGITTVLIPKRNEPDLEDVPEKVREALSIHPVSDVREVLEPGAGAGELARSRSRPDQHRSRSGRERGAPAPVPPAPPGPEIERRPGRISAGPSCRPTVVVLRRNEPPSRPSARGAAATNGISADSSCTLRLILLSPSRRSAKWIGSSTIFSPRWTVR